MKSQAREPSSASFSNRNVPIALMTVQAPAPNHLIASKTAVPAFDNQSTAHCPAAFAPSQTHVAASLTAPPTATAASLTAPPTATAVSLTATAAVLAPDPIADPTLLIPPQTRPQKLRASRRPAGVSVGAAMAAAGGSLSCADPATRRATARLPIALWSASIRSGAVAALRLGTAGAPARSAGAAAAASSSACRVSEAEPTCRVSPGRARMARAIPAQPRRRDAP